MILAQEDIECSEQEQFMVKVNWPESIMGI